MDSPPTPTLGPLAPSAPAPRFCELYLDLLGGLPWVAGAALPTGTGSLCPLGSPQSVTDRYRSMKAHQGWGSWDLAGGDSLVDFFPALCAPSLIAFP